MNLERSALKILLVEDSAADAELLLRELRGMCRPIEHRRVASETGLVSALAEFEPDIVLSDYSMPGFGGCDALQIVTERTPKTPFVFVSGTIGEERAIEALQRGASDYVLKENLRRLPTAVERALRVARERAERESVERALQVSEERFRALVETSRDWIWENDADMRLQYSNSALAEILGYSALELHGRKVIDLMLEQDRQEVEQRLPGLIASREGWQRWRLRWRHRDGECRVLESSGAPFFDESGRLIGFRGVDHDVTEQIRQETRIRQLARIHAIMGALGTVVLRKRDRDALVRDACRIAVEHGGFTVAAVGVRSEDNQLVLAQAFGCPDVLKVLAPRCAVGISPQGEGFEHLCVEAFRTGAIAVVEDFSRSDRPAAQRALMDRAGVCSELCLPIGAGPWGVLALYSDVPRVYDDEEVTLLSRLADEIDHALDFIAKSERLEYLAYHDSVTGLPNRLALHRHIESLVCEGAVVAVAFEIRRIGRIYSSRGRDFGNALLGQVGHALQEMQADGLLLAHADADKFIVAYRQALPTSEEVARIEQFVHALGKREFQIGGEQIHVGLRAGLATGSSPDVRPERLERDAMAALDEAGELDVPIHVYSEAVGQRALQQVELERGLRAAIDAQQFEIYYQPKFDALTRRVTGAEALVRWRKPGVGLVSPADFIPVLEDTGLIVPVGEWIMRDALRTALEWRAMLPGFRVAVNISARELRAAGFLAQCEALLAPHADDQPIDIEVTESVLMEDVDQSVRLLEGLRRLGCGVAIDDFGTGYSSLNYLVRLPVDTLKIDRSFIEAIEHSPETVTLISSVINMAHSLTMKVVAEGVETEEQAKLLRLLRCDHLQGYLMGRPMTAAAFAAQVLEGAAVP